MTEKQNQGIQNEKRVQECAASFAFLMGWAHGRCGLSGAPASSIARSAVKIFGEERMGTGPALMP